MIVAELIENLKQLNPNQRIIVSVKEKKEHPLPFDTYHKGDIQEIAFHMNDNGINAYALEVEDSFIEYVRS